MTSNPAPNNARRGLAAYYAELVRFAPKRFAAACALNLASVAFSGIGLLALPPLLHAAGWLPAGAAGSAGGLAGVLLARAPVHGLSLGAALAFFVGLLASAAALEYGRQRLIARLRADFLHEQRRRLNAALAAASWPHLAAQRLGHAQHMLTSGLAQVASLTHHALQLTSDAVLVIASLALAAAVSPTLTLLAAAILLPLLLLYRWGTARRVGAAQFLANRALHDQLAAFLDGLKPAKSHDLADAYVARFGLLLDEERRHLLSFARAQGRSRFLLQVVSALVFASLFYLGVRVLRLPAATFLVLLLLFARVLPRLTGALQTAVQAVNLAPAYLELRALRTDYEAHPEPPASGSPFPFHVSIRLEGVTWRHPDGGGLENVTAELPANAIIALAGPSGSGKTTLADVLAGLLPPQSGSVRIDGALLDANRAADWRRLLGYVPQDPFLFSGTLRENLTWGNGVTDEARLWEALRAAAAEPFVRALPQGLDTRVGDGGSGFSGGERQRLILARALLRAPRLLILDEATSALDLATEGQVHEALRALHGKLTLVVISHRPETLELADVVLRLEGGRLVETRTRAG